MSDILIAFFSHKGETYFPSGYKVLEKGNASLIADKVEVLVKGDVFEIKPLNQYPESYGECCEVAKQELEANKFPKLLEYLPSIKNYNKVVLIYPCWWGTMPQCVFSFLKYYDFKDKVIYPICTHEGSEMGRSAIDIVKMCPKAIVHKGLAIRGSKIALCDNSLKEYLKSLIETRGDCDDTSV